MLEGEATKARLGRLLGKEEKPALLFTAGHGMGFPAGNARQLPHQGALLCQDWPGPEQWRRAIPPDFYFAGDDVSDEAQPQGLIGFFFAPYSAGTPQQDDFPLTAEGTRHDNAPSPFVTRLPSRLLSHPRGGALAVVGHVERVWGFSIENEKQTDDRDRGAFFSMLKRLMEGYPVGAAKEFPDDWYMQLHLALSEEGALLLRQERKSEPRPSGSGEQQSRARQGAGGPAP